MRTLQELGAAIAVERRALRLKQKDVALQAGITPESLLRFERGQVSEFGSRKLPAVLAVLWYGSDLRKIGHVRLPR
jgi:HTH-type transcriptional regulator/antitoxin HipB